MIYERGIMELNVASMQDIQNELKRREMVAKDTRIKDLIYEINIAYNTGKISQINKDDVVNSGASEVVTKYYIFLK